MKNKNDARFVDFANHIIEVAFDGGCLDGGDIQDYALHYGLLRQVQALEPCGENCRCAGYGEFPAVCFRKTYQTKNEDAEERLLDILEAEGGT